jgi:dCTP diphosphatase
MRESKLINNIALKLQEFASKRDWDQFHSPKNLSMALAGEVGELLEIFQWLKEHETTKENISKQNLEKIKEELADVFIYTIRIADKLSINLVDEVNKKIVVNKKKYPIKLSKGNATKYNRRNTK